MSTQNTQLETVTVEWRVLDELLFALPENVWAEWVVAQHDSDRKALFEAMDVAVCTLSVS